ncbi:spermidine synthase [Balneatrix alpica]|uniref:Spermidine synthase n=1 Tax=Balneatrix alpica TaxID=75684 RepID=A0ABV5ZEP0_9GAMM|nr:methyltransferase domain-containing protein [Balneatrix alpica]
MAEQEIYRAYDEWGVIRVIDGGPYRYLCFGDEAETEQACILRTNPFWIEYDYVQAMLLSLVLHERPQRALVLGLGGGTLAQALLRVEPALSIQVVELRQGVIEAAQQFFAFPASHPRMELLRANALEVVRSCPDNSFDLILTDLYLEQGMAAEQGQQSFLEACGRVLGKRGWLVLNHWQEGNSGRPQDEARLAEVFPHYWLCPVEEGNVVVFARQGEALAGLSRAQVDQARQLGRQLQLPLGRLLNRLRPGG